MRDTFEWAAGTVPGSLHRTLGMNNQDGHHVLCEGDCLVAVVTDGCGSCAHSEVGAKLGARLTVDAVLIRALMGPLRPEDHEPGKDSSFWRDVQRDLLERLRKLCVEIGTAEAEFTLSYLLFTIVGALITRERSVFFSFGDGVLYVNGERIRSLGPYPKNSPPYLAYGLRDDPFREPPDPYNRFTLHGSLPTSQLEHWLIATDGAEHLPEAEQTILRQTRNLFGPISQFWRNDRYFAPSQGGMGAVSGALFSLNEDGLGLNNWAEGLLSDDTTLVVGRRKNDALDHLETIRPSRP